MGTSPEEVSGKTRKGNDGERRGESVTATGGFLIGGEVKTAETERGTRGQEGFISQRATPPTSP